MYAYKTRNNIIYNFNYNLWTQIKYYTKLISSVKYQYKLNQTWIFWLAKILLEESKQTITKALKSLVTNNINYS